MKNRNNCVKKFLTHFKLIPTDTQHLKPSFLVIGVQKAGTTSLFHYLSQHPQIEPPNLKEICFFNNNKNYRKGYSWYHGHFPLLGGLAQNTTTFEVSVGYACHRRVPERIYEYNPNMRLILILRDPVDRAYSQWNMGRNFVNHKQYSYLAEHRDFNEIIQYEIDMIRKGVTRSKPPLSYIERGLYIEQINNYLKYFPHRQIFITENNKLRFHRAEVLNSILHFLGLPPLEWDDKQLTEHFKADYHFKKIDAESSQLLSEFFRPYNDQLFEFLGEKYDWK